MLPPPTGPFNLAEHFLGDRLREGLGERTAILCGERSFSYREVDAMACRFAHRLTRAGIEPEERVGVDTHIVLVPSPGGPVPTPIPMPFNGTLLERLAQGVEIEDCAVALKGSKAKNMPPHIPMGGPFQSPPDTTGEIMEGSSTVMVEETPVARMGDKANTCTIPQPHRGER